MRNELPLVIVSADGHVAARPDTYLSYLEPAYRDRMEDVWGDFLHGIRGSDYDKPETIEVVDPDHTIRTHGRTGGFDVARRMAELDREGIAAEIVFPGTNTGVVPFCTSLSKPYPPEMRAAGARAYHRWLSDLMAESDGRMYGVANPGPCLDMEQTLTDLRSAADHGFVSVSVPGVTADPALPPIWKEHFEPFWAACEDLGLVLSIHAGHGRLQGHRRPTRREDKALFAPDLTARRAMWQLMLGGVFDRHPRLTLALTETRADWLPATLELLDGWAESIGVRGLKPSDCWSTHGVVGASSIRRVEVDLRHRIGVERMMFGTDFPHIESTWPNTRDWVRDALGRLPEPELRRILGETAIATYGLDQVKLESVAARVGFSPAQLGSDPISPELLDTFEQRAGYLRPAEKVSSADLRSLFEEDSDAFSGARQRN